VNSERSCSLSVLRCQPTSLVDLSLPKRVAESFRTLVVRNNVSAKRADLISRKFPNIRQLFLGSEFGTERVWIQELGRNVEFLRCPGFSADIANYCPHLRHLDLYRLNAYWPAVKSLERVGEKLETLEVTFDTDAKYAIELVEKFCRKIKRLEISGQNDPVREAITKCIVSYGNQLERIRLDSLTENQLLRVKNACPKARINLKSYDCDLPQAVKIVGSELEEVTVDSLDYSSDGEEIMVDWSACANIEILRFLCDITVAGYQRFFDSPKCHLRSIDIRTGCELEDVKAIISLIAKGTGGLEEFMCICDETANGMFKELVDSNRSIRKVRISFYVSGRDNEVAIDLVETFLKSTSLKQLVVHIRPWWGPVRLSQVPIPEIERICRNQGCRSVCISVFGLSYLR